MSVVIDIADAGCLRPTGAGQAGLLGDLSEVSGSVVFIELGMRGRAVGYEDVVGAVAIEIEDGYAGAGAFEDGGFFVFAAEGVGHGQAGFRGDVDELDLRGFG